MGWGALRRSQAVDLIGASWRIVSTVAEHPIYERKHDLRRGFRWHRGVFGETTKVGVPLGHALLEESIAPVFGVAECAKGRDPARHLEVRDVAQRLKTNLPNVGLVLGELYQDRTRPDPYLVAEYRGARIVLGIWEDERLILCA